jgi:hypothetical protein
MVLIKSCTYMMYIDLIDARSAADSASGRAATLILKSIESSRRRNAAVGGGSGGFRRRRLAVARDGAVGRLWDADAAGGARFRQRPGRHRCTLGAN